MKDVLLGVALIALTFAWPHTFEQSAFPCQEDEVLMFVDNAVSKDATGCVPLDYLLSYKENN